ncbi:chitin disaccharide deacetylase [Bacillus mangrovi]|uniref:Chitin disaccharide deacetylase n=1 Tax=Metabacillus mangrovi TaxID=1491830 RepID=A0A7X2S664_9BACI|nr:chitin disaccharide deacetylase [Metabacillus mangrovi]MTH54384.1 chitin disaccharide deacetylase [Metabacillus mangrovi]
MTPLKLILNADDFGLCPGVNYAITDCLDNGRISSATMMMNMPGTDHAVKLAKTHKLKAIGVHFVLTAGIPFTEAASLRGPDGRFFSQAEFWGKKLEVQDIREELQAQLVAFLKEGLKPSHFDSHHHVHRHPLVWEVLKEMADTVGAPIRDPLNNELPGQSSYVKCRLNQEFYGKLSLKSLTEILEKNENEEWLEVMCHPGYADAFLLKSSSYTLERVRETEILLSEEFGEMLAEKRVIVKTYTSLTMEEMA